MKQLGNLTKSTLLAVLVMLTSCATEKQLHEHEVRTIVADMMAKQSQEDSHSHQQTLNVDSMVSQSVRNAFSEWQSQQTEKETTTETITTWVDSLGREIRQEQRTTQRELSRQEHQRQQEILQQMQLEMQHQLSERDSLWSQRITELQQHLSDSLAAQRDLVKHTDTTKVVSWWSNAVSWLKGILAAVLIISLYIFGRKHLRKMEEND